MELLENVIEDVLTGCGQEYPPVDIVTVVREYGIDIEAGEWRSDQPLGMAFLEDDLIILKNTLPHPKMRFVLAHEFAHFFLAREPVHSCRPDEFAMRILVPEYMIKAVLRENKKLQRDNTEKLAAIFEIPVEKMAERLLF